MKQQRLVVAALFIAGALLLQFGRDNRLMVTAASACLAAGAVGLMILLKTAQASPRVAPFVPPSPEDVQRKRRIAARTFVVSAAIAAAVVFGYDWQDSGDFDVTGFLWLLMNGLPAFVVLASGMIALAALWVWLETSLVKQSAGR